MTRALVVTDLDALLADREGAHLEFKEAKTAFEFDEVARYSSALANEGGGRLVLGVREKKPRRIVGSRAFESRELGHLETSLYDRIGLKVVVEECHHPDGRVLVFHVPAALPGRPVSDRGSFFMRAGDSVRTIEPDQLLRLLLGERDHSAESIAGATIADLDRAALESFRERCAARAPRRQQEIAAASPAELLRDAKLLDGDVPTRACLLLLGTADALREHLPQAEIVVEFRSSDAKERYDDRANFREPFLLAHDRIWEWIGRRSFLQHFQQGLIVEQIPTLNEEVVREAISNAFCHRDYVSSASVMIRQWETRIEISSPGGFPEGISVENILFEQRPRNRALAEAMERCRLAERSNHGAKLMFGGCAREGKAPPDFSKSDARNVRLRLDGQVTHPEFLAFLQRVGNRTMSNFHSLDFVVLDRIHREQPIPKLLEDRVARLIELEVVESIGRGRGRRFMLSRRFYQFVGKKGDYTRKRGLDRHTNRALLEKHIRDNALDGSPFADFPHVLPALSRAQIQALLRELRAAGAIRVVGRTKSARWYPAEHSPGGPA